MPDLFIPHVPGNGDMRVTPRKMRGVDQRIEDIGKLNDRRLKANGDPDLLRALAKEYRKRHMPKIAAEIEAEL